jgi:hypothetical protein
VIAADAVFGSSLELTDKSGDEVRFVLGGTGASPQLQLFVNGEMFADEVDTVTYEKADRRVKVEGTLSDEEDGETYEVDGDFILPDGPQLVTLATIAILAARTGADWMGDEPVALPAELEAKLVDDELKASRPGVSGRGRRMGSTWEGGSAWEGGMWDGLKMGAEGGVATGGEPGGARGGAGRY